MLPEGIPYFPITKTSIHFVDLEGVDRKTAKLFDIPERSLIDYIKKDILPSANIHMPDDLKKEYIIKMFRTCEGLMEIDLIDFLSLEHN